MRCFGASSVPRGCKTPLLPGGQGHQGHPGIHHGLNTGSTRRTDERGCQGAQVDTSVLEIDKIMNEDGAF